MDSTKQWIYCLCLLQVAQHYIVCIQTFTKSLGWHIVALNSHIGVGDLEPVGNAVGAIIASPLHDKFVKILLNFINIVIIIPCSVYLPFLLSFNSLRELAICWPKEFQKPL